MNHKQYLSTYMYDGERWWSIVKGSAAGCAASKDRDKIIGIYRQKFPGADMPVWNGDIGKFVTLEEIP